MIKRPTSLAGVLLLEATVFTDERGWFSEFFKSSTFAELGLPTGFVQDNFSVSHRGVIRGLHFQIEPFAQGKLVTCIHGAVYDVVVDLRQGSPTFGKSFSVELSEKEALALYVPEGFAHGFQALENDSRVFYKCTNVYSKTHEEGIVYNDPRLAIKWPIPSPVVSTKDLELPTLDSWRKDHHMR
jgi:dTDP-4-dehydrorhamnose 3,5-epimerase